MQLGLGSLAIALEALGYDGSVGSEPLPLTCCLEHVATLTQGHLGPQPSIASLDQGISVQLELPERGLATLECLLGARDGLLGDLEPPGILIAARLQASDGVLESSLGP